MDPVSSAILTFNIVSRRIDYQKEGDTEMNRDTPIIDVKGVGEKTRKLSVSSAILTFNIVSRRIFFSLGMPHTAA